MNATELIQHLLVYHPDSPLLFNSHEFLFLAIVVMSVYAAIYRNKLSRTLFLLVFSLFFYYKTSGLFVLLLFGTLTGVYFITATFSLWFIKRYKLYNAINTLKI